MLEPLRDGLLGHWRIKHCTKHKASTSHLHNMRVFLKLLTKNMTLASDLCEERIVE